MKNDKISEILDEEEIPRSRKGRINQEQTTIRLPAELKERLRQEAERKGMSFNQLMMIIIDEYLSIH